MARKKNFWAWILGIVGFLGVFIPHIALLVKVAMFNPMWHAIWVLISLLLMVIAFSIKK
mgnify:CR=1 FL=1